MNVFYRVFKLFLLFRAFNVFNILIFLHLCHAVSVNKYTVSPHLFCFALCTFCSVRLSLQIVVAIYVAALLSQASRFVEYDFVSVNVTSRVDPTVYVTGCRYRLTSFIRRHEQVGCSPLARRLVAPPPPRERGIAMSVSVRPSARLYVGLLENVFAMDFHTSFMHATCDRVSRSSSGGVATRYVLPVLLMTPCFPLWLCGAGPARGVLTHDDSP